MRNQFPCYVERSGDVIPAFVPWKDTSKWQRWPWSHLILLQSYHWLSLATEWLDTKHPEASDFGRITAKDFVWTKQNILVVSTQNRFSENSVHSYLPCNLFTNHRLIDPSEWVIRLEADWKPMWICFRYGLVLKDSTIGTPHPWFFGL